MKTEVVAQQKKMAMSAPGSLIVGGKNVINHQMVTVGSLLTPRSVSPVFTTSMLSYLLRQLNDKRIPDGPSSTRALPPTTPSAPRADLARSAKPEGTAGREWGGRRDQPARSPGVSSGKGPNSQANPEPLPASQSLRLRMGLDVGQGDRNRDSPKDDDRDGGRKRPASGMCRCSGG